MPNRKPYLDEESTNQVPAIRLLIRVLWVGTVGVIAWMITDWLLYDPGHIGVETIYKSGISRDTPEILIVLILTLICFFIINLMIWIGFFWAVPSGRRRPNRASIYSRDPHYN